MVFACGAVYESLKSANSTVTLFDVGVVEKKQGGRTSSADDELGYESHADERRAEH